MELYVVMVYKTEDDGDSDSIHHYTLLESISTTFEKARKKAAEVGNIEYLKLLNTEKMFYNDMGMEECEYEYIQDTDFLYELQISDGYYTFVSVTVEKMEVTD